MKDRAGDRNAVRRAATCRGFLITVSNSRRLPVRETCYTLSHHLPLRRLQHGGKKAVW